MLALQIDLSRRTALCGQGWSLLAAPLTQHARNMVRQANEITWGFTGNADKQSASGGLIQ
jgi:hypothetical protein